MSSKRQKNGADNQSTLLSIALLIIAGIVAAQLYLMWKSGSLGNLLSRMTPTTTPRVSQAPEGPTPTPTPRPLRQGEVTMNTSVSAETKGPKLSTTIVDNNDPKVGQTQTLTSTYRHTSPITSVTVTLMSDNGEKTYPMTLISGTNTDGQWQGTWTVEDTLLYTYTFIFTAKAQDGTQSKITIARR
jgi:hypothetical protein